MNKYQEMYARKLASAEEAVKVIESGDDIWFPVGGGEPQLLPKALVERKEEFRDVIINQILPLKPTYFKQEYAQHIKHNSWFCSGASRAAINEGWGEFFPNYFHEIPKLLSLYRKANVAMATVSPMDKNGYFSLGIGVDYMMAAVAKADKVILEVNPNSPRTMGNCFVHISQVTHIVECNDPLPILPVPPITEIEQSIGNFVADLIEDGSTLQIGVGGIPNAVTKALMSKHDLGMHTEMITDGVVDLVECGAVNNSKKTLHPGKIIGTFALGTKRLYDFLDDNAQVEMHPVSYTNDPYNIGKNEKMVSINASIEVDLTGQACSESMGARQFSGTGGQADFFRGANISHNGKGFVTLSATAKGGTVSRIVPMLKEGAVVTTSRNDVDHVVTEYGVAKLRGKSIRERALALINIAHPNFRDELKEKAQEMCII
ncbi:MAG: acetyl-CoA hydrolase/transferase family protein [Clostridiales bacterium]|jgi:acyl-CoA hydrolase|nr:acetyl-CoA hydrolase/transferase family protein [Clostridiales bacterium]